MYAALLWTSYIVYVNHQWFIILPRSPVGNVSGYRYQSDLKSRGREFHPDLDYQSHTFVEIDHEMISTVVLPSAESFKKGCCQLQANVCARSTG